MVGMVTDGYGVWWLGTREGETGYVTPPCGGGGASTGWLRPVECGCPWHGCHIGSKGVKELYRKSYGRVDQGGCSLQVPKCAGACAPQMLGAEPNNPGLALAVPATVERAASFLVVVCTSFSQAAAGGAATSWDVVACTAFAVGCWPLPGRACLEELAGSSATAWGPTPKQHRMACDDGRSEA